MPQWINDRERLAAIVEEIKTSRRHAMDTEFERVRTFWPKLALVQIALPKCNVLIDPLAFEDLLTLGDALHQGTPWLMHSASEDLIALKSLSQLAPKALFDTQIAAALLGLGPAISYQKLVMSELGIDLPKSETRSDWMRRPLSPQQIEYAAADVMYLEALADRLGEKLERIGRIDWLWEDGKRQIAVSCEMLYPDNPHHEFRTAHKLPAAAQWRLCALLHWREHIARVSDWPRTWILDNAIALDIAQTPPHSMAALLARLQTCRAFPKRQVGEVFELLHTDNPGATFQLAPQPLDRDSESAMKKLRGKIDIYALELGIDSSTLCTRRLLEARVRNQQWSKDCTAWRAALLEPLVCETVV